MRMRWQRRRAATLGAGRLAAAGALLAAACSAGGCLWADETAEADDPPSTGGTECFSDLSCSGGTACRESHCVSGQCVTTNVPEGVTPGGSSRELECRRVVCDGQGNERSIVDKTVLPRREAPACQKFGCNDAGEAVLLPDTSSEVRDQESRDCKVTVCDAAGNLSSRPDPTDLPGDEAGDCRVPACTADGSASSMPDPTDLPADVAGDCKAPACGADGAASTTVNVSDVPEDKTRDCKTPACGPDGTITSTNNNDDVPADTACQTFTCANGTATGAPINEGQNCSDLGFVCNSGNCNLCPAPDAACTDPGPGNNSHSPGTAFGFGGIGHCDSGGRRFCGAVSANETTFYSFRDNGTGTIFCEFDPNISISSTAPVTLCEYFSCATVSCPSGSTPSTSGGLNGCCVDANSTLAAMRIGACSNADVLVSVKAKPGTTCAGYTLNFNL